MKRPAADLLFEIGTEELPAAYLPGLIRELADAARRLVASHHLRAGTVETYGTPRRLVLLVRGLKGAKRSPAEEIRGPSKQAAFDSHGKPTPALLGFLRAQGGTLEQLQITPSPKGEYVALRKPARELPTERVLPQLLPQLLGALHAPKTMRWDASGLRFARPIRWVMAFYGTRHIGCTVGQLRSAPRTWVGLPKRPRAVRVSSAAQYFKALARAGIIVDQRARQQLIANRLKRLARHEGGRPAQEMAAHGLLEEVTCLVEQPVALVGRFQRKYLHLPREVLLASMAKYQRVFALDAAGSRQGRGSGKLLPTFVAILDGEPGEPTPVRAMVEHILNARLADALLFWEEDRHLTLEQMATQLSGVTFHEQLGSMAQKADRLHTLGAVLEQAWDLSPSEREQLRRACQLAKADLVSAMVKEFPTLQGVMGKSYARDSGEPSEVAQALEEQYLPSGARLPKTLIGRALAIVDKYDTLSSYFAIGIEPTGDKDPYGLRRAAQGIVEVAWAVHRPFPLDRLLEAQVRSAHFAFRKEESAVRKRIQEYLFERLYTFSWPNPVPSRDLIDAVLSGPGDDLVDVMDRIRSLQQLDGQRSLLKAAKVVERTHNILRGAECSETQQVDSARFQEPLERQLWDLYERHKPTLDRLIRQDRNYAEATTLYGEVFFEPLHEFFARVLVNVPDRTLQQNRLALMRLINTLYTERIADLSKLTILQRGETS